MSYGEKIQKLRESRGLTQNELAEEARITQSMLCQLERGSKILTVPLAHAIAKALGVKITDIVGE